VLPTVAWNFTTKQVFYGQRLGHMSSFMFFKNDQRDIDVVDNFPYVDWRMSDHKFF
ncbi:Hypothetical protein FKW44_014805, partial [Caligus rogercresseyi]